MPASDLHVGSEAALDSCSTDGSTILTQKQKLRAFANKHKPKRLASTFCSPHTLAVPLVPHNSLQNPLVPLREPS